MEDLSSSPPCVVRAADGCGLTMDGKGGNGMVRTMKLGIFNYVSLEVWNKEKGEFLLRSVYLTGLRS